MKSYDTEILCKSLPKGRGQLPCNCQEFLSPKVPNKSQGLFDVIIVGTGPAGLTAGLYTARYNMKTLILGKLFGGMVAETHEICNFPSYEKIGGIKLAKKMIEQVKNLGAEIRQEEILEIEGKDGNFEVVSDKEKYNAKKIILATGTKKRELNIPREKELAGRGVSYCTLCDSALYKNKVVAVVGGGSSALSSALLLSKFAKKVYIIYRREKFVKAEPILVNKIEKEKNIETIFNATVEKLFGEKKLEEIELSDGRKMKIDGLFIEGGSVPWDELSKKLGLKFDEKYVAVDKNMKTSVKGIFAAGDMTNNPLKQIVTACGEGAIAAKSAYDSLGE